MPHTTHLKAGDIIFFHGSHWPSRLIQLAQRIRFGQDPATYWTHCAIIIAPGVILEALGSGVKTRIFPWNETRPTHIVHLHLSDDERFKIASYALRCSGHRYGWLTIASIALTILTPSRFTFGLYGTEICSGLCARALEHAGWCFDTDPASIMPAQLFAQIGEKQCPP